MSMIAELYGSGKRGVIVPDVLPATVVPKTQTGESGSQVPPFDLTGRGIFDRGGDEGGRRPTDLADQPGRGDCELFVQKWTSQVPPEVDALAFQDYRIDVRSVVEQAQDSKRLIGLLLGDYWRDMMPEWYREDKVALGRLVEQMGFTHPCRSFLLSIYGQCRIINDRPPAEIVPVGLFDIDLPRARYGPFTPGAHIVLIGSIERNLLKIQRFLMGHRLNTPKWLDAEEGVLHTQWVDAYIRRYGIAA